MAEYIKITTIGPKNTFLPESLSYMQIADEMIELWKKRFLQIMCDKPDLIVMPENTDIPFNLPLENKIDYCRERGNVVLDYFRETARKNSCYMVYTSGIFDEDGNFRNAAVMIDRKGDIAGQYYKNYLTAREFDEGRFSYGTEAELIECDFGRVGIAICYDLNFDELMKRYAEQHPDLIIFPSMYHGGLV